MFNPDKFSDTIVQYVEQKEAARGAVFHALKEHNTLAKIFDRALEEDSISHIEMTGKMLPDVEESFPPLLRVNLSSELSRSMNPLQTFTVIIQGEMITHQNNLINFIRQYMLFDRPVDTSALYYFMCLMIDATEGLIAEDAPDIVVGLSKAMASQAVPREAVPPDVVDVPEITFDTEIQIQLGFAHLFEKMYRTVNEVREDMLDFDDGSI